MIMCLVIASSLLIMLSVVPKMEKVFLFKEGKTSILQYFSLSFEQRLTYKCEERKFVEGGC